MKGDIEKLINESIEVKKKVIETLSGDIEKAAKEIIDAYKKGGKVVLCGNGGSAADAQHMAGELVHQFEIKGRRALPAIALSANTSILTAIGNDWSFDDVFERQAEALVNNNDVFIGITTSGNSTNIIKAVEMAKSKGAFTIALTGKDGGEIKEAADLSLIIPSEKTARIQESHITIIHILCSLVEREF